MDIFKKPEPRKRTMNNKMVRETLNVINRFRENLSEAQQLSQQKNPLATNTTVNSRTYDKAKSLASSKTKSCLKSGSRENRAPIKVYPAWRSTATFTPIFAAKSNPRWPPKKFDPDPNPKPIDSPIKDKMYTPGHIQNWLDVDDTSPHCNGPPSCKTIRYTLIHWAILRVMMWTNSPRFSSFIVYLLNIRQGI